MEADRGAVLTVRAAARGVIDFSAARVHDVAWWRRTNALIQSMAADDELATIRAAFDYQRSLVGNGSLTEASFKEIQKSTKQLFQELVNTINPWASKSAEESHARQTSGLIEAYKQFIGDPDDPEFRRKLVADRERQKAGDVAPVKDETDDQRIDRLLKERDEHYARQRGVA